MVKFFDKKKKAFTLAEIMSVIAILGVVAVITIPTAFHNHGETANRSKIKKALETYDRFMSQVAIENRITTNTKLDNIILANNCLALSNYFKNAQSCTFRTPDGIWWYFGDTATRPLISLKDEITAANLNAMKARAENLNDREVFCLVGKFDDNGLLRINDLNYESVNGDANTELYISKLNSFVNNAEIIMSPRMQKIVNFNKDMEVVNSGGIWSRPCSSNEPPCVTQTDNGGGEYRIEITGSDGKFLVEAERCAKDDFHNCNDSSTIYNTIDKTIKINGQKYNIVREGVSLTGADTAYYDEKDNIIYSIKDDKSECYSYVQGACNAIGYDKCDQYGYCQKEET